MHNKLILASLISLSTACGSKASDEPPAICRTPTLPTTTSAPWLKEVTADVGLAKSSTLEPLATKIFAADIDGDGWQDFFAAVFPSQREPVGMTRTRFLFMNRPSPTDPGKRIFVESLDASGLLATRDGQGGRGLTTINFADLDGDGDLDAIGCADLTDPTIVKDGCAAFLNDGTGHFTLSAMSGDLEKDLLSVRSSAVLDYDRDGVLDFWPATIGQWQYGPAVNTTMRFYHGIGDGTFTDASMQVGLPSTLVDADINDYHMIFGVTSCDVDLDGDRDILLAEYGVEDGANHVFINDNGKFVDKGEDLGVSKGPPGQGGFTYDIACGDLDDDGDVDLFTAELQHEWYPTTDFSEPLMNNTPVGQPLSPYTRPGRAALGFTRPHVGTQWTEGDSQIFFADLDLDGRKDVTIVSNNYPQQSAADPDWTHTWLYHQKDDGTFEDVTMTATPFWDKTLQSLGDAALFDFDNDGDLDVVTGTCTYNTNFVKLTNTVHVFENEVGQDSNLVRVRVIGKGKGFSNTSGIGARVEITAGGRTQMQEVLGAHGTTQSDVTLTFGLGAACQIDQLVVHWPDLAGTVTTYKKLSANYLLELREGEIKARYSNLDGTAIGKK